MDLNNVSSFNEPLMIKIKKMIPMTKKVKIIKKIVDKKNVTF